MSLLAYDLYHCQPVNIIDQMIRMIGNVSYGRSWVPQRCHFCKTAKAGKPRRGTWKSYKIQIWEPRIRESFVHFWGEFWKKQTCKSPWKVPLFFGAGFPPLTLGVTTVRKKILLAQTFPESSKITYLNLQKKGSYKPMIMATSKNV